MRRTSCASPFFMLITKIEQQKKNKTRFSIFVDDKYAFSVSGDVYVRFVLHQGQEITETERTQIENAEAESSVRRIALRYRSYRPRSKKEILEYLQKKGYDDSHIHQAIVFLDEMKLLNDDEFARMFCRDRLRLKPVGKASMKHLLFKKGIDKQTVENILPEFYTEESENNLAMKEAERKYKRVKSLPIITQKKRIFEHLVRRGYDTSLSRKVTTQLVNQ
ncbi:MAG: RecX family transcriptional regulator [Bacteroidota bacterium]|nr:RecX family transcriptional regulator [Bacteroidota bacterium]